MSASVLPAQIAETARRYGVPPELALAVARKESGLNQAARGAAGEVGIFQLMPTTAAALGVNAYDPAENIEGGVRYLRQMLDRYGWDPLLALAAYNGGPGNVDRGTVSEQAWAYAQEVLGSLSTPPAFSSLLPSSDTTLLAAAAVGLVSLAVLLAA